MKAQLFFGKNQLFMVLKENDKQYITNIRTFHITEREMYLQEGRSKADVFRSLFASEVKEDIKAFLQETKETIELNEEETERFVQQIFEWINKTERLYLLPRLTSLLGNAYWINRKLSYNLLAAFRFDSSTKQFSKLTFNYERKEIKPRSVRIGYILELLQPSEKKKQEILSEWEEFLAGDQGIRIEVLESTLRNWRRIYHPELTPVKSCMTYRHLYTKVGRFYMALPAKPILILRGNTPIGRTICWEDKYYDRIYCCSEQSRTHIIARLQKQGLRPIFSEKLVYSFDPTIIRERKFIPYLDYMHWFGAINKNEALLSNNAEHLLEILKQQLPEKNVRIIALCVPSHKERYDDAMRILRLFEV